MFLFLCFAIVLCLAAIVIGAVIGRKYKSRWEEKVASSNIEAMKIKQDTVFPVEDRLRRMIACYEDIGFELESVDEDTLKFGIPGRNWLPAVIEGLCFIIFFGPLYPSFLLGRHYGSRGAGSKREKFLYRLNFKAPIQQRPSKLPWYLFWKC